MRRKRIIVDEDRLARLLSMLHATDASLSVLQRICMVCEHTPWMDGAGVSRIQDGKHETLVATSPVAEQVERLQVEFAQGPCVEALSTSRQFREPDLRSDPAMRRWPDFAPAAVDQGVEAVFAFPLLRIGSAAGALDLYSRRTGDMNAEQIEDTLLLADLAALAIEQYARPSSVDGVALSAEANEPWAHPAAIHNASGMVAEQLGIDPDAALLRLRAVAFATDRSLADVAAAVLSHQLRLESWSGG